MPDVPADNVAALAPMPQGAAPSTPRPTMQGTGDLGLPPEAPPPEAAANAAMLSTDPGQAPMAHVNDDTPPITSDAARDFYQRNGRLPSIHEIRAMRALPVIQQQLGGRRPTKQELLAFLDGRNTMRTAPDVGLLDPDGQPLA